MSSKIISSIVDRLVKNGRLGGDNMDCCNGLAIEVCQSFIKCLIGPILFDHFYDILSYKEMDRKINEIKLGILLFQIIK